MKRPIVVSLILAAVLTAIPFHSAEANTVKVKIATTMGDITAELYPDKAPKTVDNFVTLAKKGFYDGLTFHRVIKDFMIQGGDPTGTGRGGPGYAFADELNPATPSYKAGYVRGTVAMANSGPNTNGSQFFIMHKDYALPHSYTIFGRVVSGMDVVDAIASSQTGPGDRPVSNITMNKVTVAEKK
jgi:cyclophilin family peptidyl-prolyl cis-trans isomerase